MNIINKLFMNKFLNKHKDELVSFFQTFIAILAVDGAGILTQLYDGQWDDVVLTAVGFAVARSFVKTVLQELLPSLFPKRTSNKK